MKTEKLYFESIKEDRGQYYVIYTPPFTSFQFALLGLVFPEDADKKDVATAMEKELLEWLKRFPIPLMVTACDGKNEMYHFDSIRESNYLIGYIDKESKKIKSFWGKPNDEEIPKDALDPVYLKQVYSTVPYKTKEQLTKENTKNSRQIRIGSFIVVGWVVIPPVAISIIGWRNPFIGGIVVIFGLAKAFIKTMQLLGKWKKSPWEIEREKEEQLKEHHHYHCMKNPEGFERLKYENFERWSREDIQKEAKEIKEKQQGKISKKSPG